MKFNQTGWNELFTSHRSVDFIIATNAGRLSRCDGPATLQSIAHFFYLSWYLIRSCQVSRVSGARDCGDASADCELDAEAEQAEIDDEDQGHS